VPQLAALVVKSTQLDIAAPPRPPKAGAVAVQKVRPASPQPAMHAPPWHVDPGAQACPQVPQLASSAFVFVQVAPHIVSPAPQAHEPPTQAPPLGHSVPQAPQLSGSLDSLTHALLQLVNVAPASVVVQTVEQLPSLQTCPAVHATSHPPQLFGSVRTEVHDPFEQRIDPLAHSHSPFWHCVPAPHRVPQAPQLALSAAEFTQDAPHWSSPAVQAH